MQSFRTLYHELQVIFLDLASFKLYLFFYNFRLRAPLARRKFNVGCENCVCDNKICKVRFSLGVQRPPPPPNQTYRISLIKIQEVNRPMVKSNRGISRSDVNVFASVSFVLTIRSPSHVKMTNVSSGLANIWNASIGSKTWEPLYSVKCDHATTATVL